MQPYEQHNNYTAPQEQCIVNADQVAHQLIINGKKQGPRPTYRKQDAREPMLASPFQMEDLLKGIKALKNNKTVGQDGILCGKIKNFGPVTLHRVLQMMNSILWRKSKVIYIFKPGNTRHYLRAIQSKINV